MSFKGFVTGFACASTIVAFAYAQQTTTSTSTNKQGSGSSSASATASAGGSHSGSGNGSGSGSGGMMSIPHPTHAVIYKAGEKWDKDLQVMEQPFIQDHINYWNKVIPTGKFIWGGPWKKEPGGMGLLIVKTDEEAQKLVMDDPAVQNGLLVPEIKPWYVGLDGSYYAAMANARPRK